jgi:sugar/nucleoside kinase (ribokinase family)
VGSNFDVIVLGAAAIDHIARVARLPGVDEIVFAEEYTRYAGGSGANIAAGLAKLGRSVAFLGKTGDDEIGGWLLKEMNDSGIDTGAMTTVIGGKSASCFIALDEQGNRVIYALGGSALLENVDELDLPLIAGSRVMCISDAYIPVAVAAAKAARNNGKTVFFIPGGLMVNHGLKDLDPILKNTNVLVVSRNEANILIGDCSPSEAGISLREAGAEVVVVTLGADGAICISEKGIEMVSAVKTSVMDTTGAGDAFAAGLINAYLDDLSRVDAVEMGSAMAAIKVSHFGATGGLPNKLELEKFIEMRNSL